MSKMGNSKGKGRFAPIVLAVTGLALAAPGAGLAVGSTLHQTSSSEAVEYLPFTPAGVDPALAQKVADLVGEDALQFTPANRPRAEGERSVNFAVRVNSDLARSISGRPARDTLAKATVTELALPVAPTRYNLGIARGYQSFTEPARKPANFSVGLRDVAMPDLSSYKGDSNDKPSRFQSRIALEQRDRAGSSPRTIEGAGTQQLDVSGSYRLSRNLDVTAGVRLSQERDRLAPLTDGQDDDQAVYVGTQIRF